MTSHHHIWKSRYVTLRKRRQCEIAFLSVSPNDDALISSAAFHEIVGVVGNGENVRRFFADFFVLIAKDVLLAVNVVELIRIDGNENGTGVRLEERLFMRYSTMKSYYFYVDVSVAITDEKIAKDSCFV